MAVTQIQQLFFLLSVTFVCSSSDELRFLVIGDWGGIEMFPYTTGIERAVNKSMSEIAEQLGTHFTIGLDFERHVTSPNQGLPCLASWGVKRRDPGNEVVAGIMAYYGTLRKGRFFCRSEREVEGDNFYDHGVKNSNDPRFQETFEQVFTAKSLMTPWYFCAGNHDHYGNVSAQIAYSSRSNRWNFPSLYYTKSWKITGSDQELQLVLLDTVQLCGNTRDDYFHDQPQGPESIDRAEKQWAWIEKTLRSSTAHYLIVGGHFPVWSIAEHGPTKCLVERLRPLLEKYNVTAYISGHDHNLQNLKEPTSSVEYFVIGCAALIDSSKEHANAVPKGSSLFFWADFTKEGGFAVVRATVSYMTLEFVDAFGSTLFTRVLQPRDHQMYLNGEKGTEQDQGKV